MRCSWKILKRKRFIWIVAKRKTYISRNSDRQHFTRLLDFSFSTRIKNKNAFCGLYSESLVL
jgi:hypothetical protein